MKLIRKSTFETNSSSCHTVTVGSSGVFEGITPNEDNLIWVPSIDFGWGQDTFTSPSERLAYAYIYARDWSSNLDQHHMSILHKVVCEHTGADGILPEDDCGYIDHQSVESHDLHYLFADESKLKSFIFDRDSIVETDNDNH
jgi:hypothetical protein